MEDEKDFEPEEFHKLILEVADAALTKFPRLPSDDRKVIEASLNKLEIGLTLLKHDDPEVLRAAARMLMWSAYAIGSCANVSDSAKIKADIDAHAAQGHNMVKMRREEREVWHARVREVLPDIRLKYPKKLSAERLEEFVRKKVQPVSLPRPRTVIEFIRLELKAGQTKDRRSAIKLVHTG